MIKKLILLSYNLVWTILFIICMFRVIVSMTDYLVKLIKKIKTIINFNKLDMCYMLYLIVSFVTSYYICNIIDTTKDKDMGAEGYLIFFKGITNININYSIFLHTLTIYCIFICLFGISIKVFLLVNKAKFIVAIIAQTVVPVVVVHLIGIFLTKQYGYVVYFVESLVLLCICIYYSLTKISELKERYKLKYNYDDTKEKTSEIGLEPIKSIDDDKLNFKPLVDIAYDYIMEKDSNENEKYIKPKSISIEGAWGTGKTSLVNLIIERLNYHSCDEDKIRYWQVIRINSAHLQKYKGSLSVAFYDKLISTSNNSLKYFFESLILEYKQNWLNSFRLLFRVDNDEIVEYINYELVVNQIGAIFVIDDLDRLDKEDIKNIIALVSEKIKIEFKKNVVMMFCFSRINLEKSLNTNLDAYNEFYLSKYSEMNLAVPRMGRDIYVNICVEWFKNNIGNQKDIIEKLSINNGYLWLYKCNLSLTEDYSDDYQANLRNSFMQIFSKVEVESVRELNKILKSIEIYYLLNKTTNSIFELNFFLLFLIGMVRFYSESIFINLGNLISDILFINNNILIKDNINKEVVNNEMLVGSLSSRDSINFIGKYTSDEFVKNKIVSIFNVLDFFTVYKGFDLIQINSFTLYALDKKYINYLIDIYSKFSLKKQNVNLSIENFISLVKDPDYFNKISQQREIVIFAIHLFLQNIKIIKSLDLIKDRDLILSVLYCPIFVSKAVLLNKLHSIKIIYTICQMIFLEQIEFYFFGKIRKDILDVLKNEYIVAIFLRYSYINNYIVNFFTHEDKIKNVLQMLNILKRIFLTRYPEHEQKNFSIKIVSSVFNLQSKFLINNFMELYQEGLEYIFIKKYIGYICVTKDTEKKYSFLFMLEKQSDTSDLSFPKEEIRIEDNNIFSFLLIVVLNYLKIKDKDIYTNFAALSLFFIYLIDLPKSESIKLTLSPYKVKFSKLLKNLMSNKQEVENTIDIDDKKYTINKRRLVIFKYIYKIVYKEK